MRKVKQPKPTPDCRKLYQLAEHYSEASGLLAEQAKGEQWGCSAPQLLVDSFAVELYLKCLFVLDTNIAPLEEHDWQTLFDALAPFTKAAIREAFERIVRSDPVLSHLDEINPGAVKVTDFERSLAAAKKHLIRDVTSTSRCRRANGSMRTLFETRSAPLLKWTFACGTE
jgi:hypothetical protein